MGKDSIRYENRVEVEKQVFKNVAAFCTCDSNGKRTNQSFCFRYAHVFAGKRPSDQLFELFDAQDLNRELKELMDGLSAKVFRTYNASITLQQQLENDLNILLPVDRKKSEYDEANKQVSIDILQSAKLKFPDLRPLFCAIINEPFQRRTTIKSKS